MTYYLISDTELNDIVEFAANNKGARLKTEPISDEDNGVFLSCAFYMDDPDKQVFADEPCSRFWELEEGR